MIEYKQFSEQYINQIVDFWNRNFSQSRNFFKISKEIFANRILNRHEPLADFVPENYTLAVESNKVIGIMHFAIYNSKLSQYFYPDTEGDVGSIYFICTDKNFRKRGIGSNLWKIALEKMKNCSRIVIDGQCLNGFYGNTEGPFTPFFGTPEGISIALDDNETLTFLKKREYLPRYEALSLELNDFSPVEMETNLINYIDNQGFQLHRTNDFLPQIGLDLKDHQNLPRQYIFESLFITKTERVIGQITYYPMTDLSHAKFGIYSTEVSADHTGKKLGSTLLNLAILGLHERGADSLEVVTLGNVEKNAQHFYEKLGFKVVAKWAIF